jgi:hypothetical protein
VAFIVAHIEDPLDILTIDVMPDDSGFKVKIFETEEDAYHYLNSIDMHPLGLFNSDIVVARLH